jgi:hypothetical protein
MRGDVDRSSLIPHPSSLIPLFRPSGPGRMLSHARTAKAGASLHEVRSDATTGRRMRLHLPSGAARGAASGAVLHFVPDLWATSRLGAPNGAHCLAQSPAAGAKARLMALPMVPSRMSFVPAVP